MANKPTPADFSPTVPDFPSIGQYQPIYGKFDLTTYINGASDYEIMAFLVQCYNATLKGYSDVTQLSKDTVTAYNQLQTWVNTWFDNLDVQTEINEKLQEMYENGSLAEAIASSDAMILAMNNYLSTPTGNENLYGATSRKINDMAQDGSLANVVSQTNEIPESVKQYLDSVDGTKKLSDVTAKKIEAMAVRGSLGIVISNTGTVQSTTTNWLQQNVTPTGSAVMVDKSLSIVGAAADSKATGNSIDSLRQDLDNLYMYSEQFINHDNFVYGEYYAKDDDSTVGTRTNPSTTRIKLSSLKAGHYYWNELWSELTFVEFIGEEHIYSLVELGIANEVHSSGEFVFTRKFNIYITFSGNAQTDYMKTVMFANADLPIYYRFGKYNIYENGVSHFDVHVGSSNTTDSNTISGAVNKITEKNDATSNHIYNIFIEDGTYYELGITLPSNVNLIGASGCRDNCKIIGALSSSASDNDIKNTSTINLSGNNVLKHLTITGKNVRYPIHSESGGATTNWNQVIDDCYVEHIGNNDVIEYRKANKLDYSGVWDAYYAWGEGVSSGAYAEFTNCHFKAPIGGRAWYVHEAENMSKPYYHRLYNCVLECSGQWSAQVCENRNSTQENNTVIFDSCQFLHGGLYVQGTYPVNIVVVGCGDIMFLCESDPLHTKHFPKFVGKMNVLEYVGTHTLVGGEILKLSSNPNGCDVASSDTPIDLIIGYALNPTTDGYVTVCSNTSYPGSKGNIGGFLGIDNATHKLIPYVSGTKVAYDMGTRSKLFIN